MEGILLVSVAAILVEALIEVVKGWLPQRIETPGWLWPLLGAVLGVGLCVLAGIDLLRLAGLSLKWAGVGEVVTGVLISRGASFVHDLWRKLRGEAASQPEDQTL